jgi:hypothetical protein
METEIQSAPGFCEQQALAIHRCHEITDLIEKDPDILQNILRMIRETTYSYAHIARWVLDGIITSKDTDGVLSSAVSEVAVRHLAEDIRRERAAEIRHVLSREDFCRGSAVSKANGGKTTFNRTEQIRGILSRGHKVWSDAEELVLIGLAKVHVREWRNGQTAVNWFEVTESLKTIFPHIDVDYLKCRMHYGSLIGRVRQGTYGREIPSDGYNAFQRAISALEADESLNGEAEHAVEQIRLLLSQKTLDGFIPQNSVSNDEIADTESADTVDHLVSFPGVDPSLPRTHEADRAAKFLWEEIEREEPMTDSKRIKLIELRAALVAAVDVINENDRSADSFYDPFFAKVTALLNPRIQKFRSFPQVTPRKEGEK